MNGGVGYWTSWLDRNNNWGRWGAADDRGAVNMIDNRKRCEAATLVRTGGIFSLSRPLCTSPGASNPKPVRHSLHWFQHSDGNGGGAGDTLMVDTHGYQLTHVDALCHAWSDTGMWNGRCPDEELTATGAKWGGIEKWADGIVTRGVLLDVARFRGTEYLSDQPVSDEELRAVAKAQGIAITAGDAMVVRGGRDAYEAAHPSWNPYTDPHPGLSVSALRVIKECDVAVVAWDFMDAQPYEFGWPCVPHAALHALGVALVDNCSLDHLAAHCASTGIFDFMLVLAPLHLAGGTGSPVNPIAIV